jgi:hypothetical protein
MGVLYSRASILAIMLLLGYLGTIYKLLRLLLSVPIEYWPRTGSCRLNRQR